LEEFVIKLVVWGALFLLAHRLSKSDFQVPSISPWPILAGLMLVYSLVFVFWNWNRHLSFNSYALDLSLYLQALGNFGLNTPILGRSLFATHFSPLLLALVPLFRLGSGPGLLFILQAVILVIPAIPLYRVSRKLGVGEWPSLLMVFVYLNFYFTRQMALSDFHVELFLPFLFLLVIQAFLEKNLALYWLALGLSLLVKEDVGFYLAAAGVVLTAFYPQRWKQSLATVGIGVIASLVSLFLVIRANHGSYPYFSYWSEYGRGVVGIASGILAHPLTAVGELFKGSLFRLVSLLAFLPLVSVWALAGLPALWVQLASSQGLQSSLNLYYAAPVLPFAFAGLAEGWVRLEGWLANSALRKTAMIGVGLFLAVFNFHWTPLAEVTPQHRSIHAMLQTIAPQAKVLAQADLAPHIPGQSRVRVLGRNKIGGADLIVFHLNGNIWPYSRESYLRALNALRMNPEFSVWKEDSGTVVFIRRKK